MNKRTEDMIRNQSISDMLNDIISVCNYMTEDGYDTSALLKAVDVSENDTVALHNALNQYYDSDNRIKPEYENIGGYLSGIGTNIRHIDYKREHNLY